MPNETKVCYVCREEKLLVSFPRGNYSKHLGDYSRGDQCSACAAKRSRARLRFEFLAAFDFKCSCCGIDHPWFLTLEHIQDGARISRRLRRENGLALAMSFSFLAEAKKESWDKSKYECLCYNCNCSKGRYGQCPHRSGVTREDALRKLKESSAYLRQPTQGGKGILRGPMSEEQKRKISAATTGISKSPETRARMVEAWKMRSGKREVVSGENIATSLGLSKDQFEKLQSLIAEQKQC